MRNVLIWLFTAVITNALAQDPTLKSSAAQICFGEAVRLTATGCEGTVKWSNGQEGLSILDTLNENKIYTAECYINGVKSYQFTTDLEVKVNPKPQTPYLFCKDDIIKLGKSATITTFGCEGTVFWNNGKEGRSIEVSPLKTSTYTATCINEFGCSAEPISRTIIVKDKENPEVPNISYKYACSGEEVILSAQGCTEGVYVWYKNSTKLFSDAVVTEEIARGISVTVTEGGNKVYYTARCQFQDCLGNSSNRLMIEFSNIIVAPIVSSKIQLTENGSVSLKSVVSEPITSGGKLVFKSTLNFNSATITTPENISIAGDYYVFEISREGNCQSTGTRIVVESVLNQALIVQDFGQNIPANLTNTTEIQTSLPIPLTSQITSDGALISSDVPNDLGNILVPQGLSPNGDGINDVFLIKNLGDEIPSLRVYNRYGHLVYNALEYKNDWDGTANTGYAKDAHLGLPDGTYYYVLKLKDGRQNISFLTIAR